MNKNLCPGVIPAAVGAALLVLSCSAHAQESRIAAVTLYPGSATIVRAARVAPGATRLEIRDLPANFDPRTIRVDADPGVRIGAVSTRDSARSSAPDPREALLEERVQALKDRQSALDGEIESAEMVTKFLGRLGTQGGAGKTAPVPDPKSLAGVIEVLSHSSGDALARVQRAQVRKRELARQVAALERDLARLKSGARDTRTIVVGVSAEKGGTARVSYQVNGAGWRPTYRASLDSNAATMELVRQAVVMQTTGEDWSGVKMKLSTGQPRVSPRGPDPRPWLVSIAPPRPEPRAASGFLAEAEAPAEPAALKRDLRDDFREAQQTQTTFLTEFEVPATVSLPSDGRNVTVTLARQTLPVRMRLRVVPRLDPAAIVTAEAARPEGVWLPGEMQLQRDGAYVGSTRWNPQSSESVSLPFGRDERVRVSFDRVKDRNGSSGLIGRKSEREVTDVLTLASFHDKPLDVLVLEPSPVSTSDEIDVRASFEPKPQTENWDNRQGVVAWERSIAPKQTLRITLDYAISYPKGGAVIGLP
ncbi:MAG TPA: DUF4139 domain-containing protein [Burkholderiales bacterium]|nr:DUF4139 domain-containing protein [Burkholderiales bacterium]